jgi:hypothetical protein
MWCVLSCITKRAQAVRWVVANGNLLARGKSVEKQLAREDFDFDQNFGNLDILEGSNSHPLRQFWYMECTEYEPKVSRCQDIMSLPSRRETLPTNASNSCHWAMPAVLRDIRRWIARPSFVTSWATRQAGHRKPRREERIYPSKGRLLATNQAKSKCVCHHGQGA